MFSQSGGEVTRRCNLKEFDLTAHANRDELLDFVGCVSPKTVVLGHGDVDFVINYPPEQYLRRYVFFADPTYPETNLVVVRARGDDGTFADVELDCAGILGGWTAVGDYEWTRVDLITGNFQGVGNCSTGAHEMNSEGRFGLWVWGWGTPNTTEFTANVSYGYPGGMNVTPINTVVIPPVPK
jgi:hypothetical protein